MLKHTLALALFACASLAHGADQPLRVGWVFAMANAPALIADKKGFYAAEGLKVDLRQFGDGPLLQQAVAAGELDLAYVGAPPVYQWASRGLEAKIIAKVNYGQAALLADAASAVTSVAGLRGKRLASLPKGSGMDVLLRGFVLREHARLDPDRDLGIVAMAPANMPAALERHAVDAAFTFEPFVSQALLRGKTRLLLDVNQALPNHPWYVIAALPATLAERPDEVVKLLRAHARAVAFLKTHPAEANRLIAAAFKLEPVQAANGAAIPAEAIVQEARKRLGWSARLETADLEFIQRLMDYSSALGFMGKPMNVADLVDTTFQRRAEQAVGQGGHQGGK
ncbi:ABC transporter substrate-binding protein [Massilia atriviolacea]|uniref:Aliphatic sulfonate ABC transporter substrate-binding protein n=1 Tax=Massilia atriviolacea TaxID=2495579 RepID=A0A430HQP5_9BURK|nr:ABC transporter substrate-binding protein [Massilia atriviolacea]RSZ59838.1 aliphatic sulfonate ABC transporter substrate-binding protein [Massilia atriviolacea]